jgi:hypothetical protein
VPLPAPLCAGALAGGVSKAHSGAQDWAALRAKYVDAAMADKAGGSMTPAVRHYLRFCVFGRHVSPMRETDVSDPLAMKVADEAFLMDFALWLVLSKPSGRSISVNTAAKYVSTVKAWHLRRFHRRIGADLELASLKDMLKGMRREIGVPPRRVRYGVRTQDLAKAMSTAYAPLAHDVGDDTERLNRLNKKAALSTAFCGLLRAAEMALQPGETWHPELNLSRADVKFHYDEHGALYAVLMMRPCKNGKYMRGKTVPIVLAGGGTLIDPVSALWELYAGDPVPEAAEHVTPLFRLRGRGTTGSLTVDQVRIEIKTLMSSLGLDPARFGAHSLRIGGATAAAAAGVPPSVIRVMGRWNSDIFEIYTRLTQQAAARMTGVIGSTAFDDLERGAFHTEELELLPSEMDVAPEFDGNDELDDDTFY